MKFKIQHYIYIIAIIAAVATVSYFVFIKFKTAGATNPAGGLTPQVMVLKLQSQKVDDFEELPARTKAYQTAEVRPQVEGIVQKVFFTEGGEVEKGQQLYQIDPATYLANYNSATADLQKAKANLVVTKAKRTRYEKLTELDAVSRQEYDDITAGLAIAKADVEIAKAAMDKAKIFLDYTKVLSPLSGYISKSAITMGQLVSANQTDSMANITQLDPIFVDIARSSEGLEKFKARIAEQKNTEEKVPVELYLSDGTLYKHQGILQFSEVNVDPTTSAVQIRALFENPDQILLPGSFVKVRIKMSYSNAILVPQKAAFRAPDGSLMVWIVDEQNKVKAAPIKTLKAIGNNWIVSDGLKDGDIIVIDGLQKVAPDATVVPVLAKTPSSDQ